jgi:hypothetical protein
MLLTVLRNRKRQGRAVRSLALTLVSASLLGQIAGFAHLALSAHSVCAAHGEAVHPSQEPSASATGAGFQAFPRSADSDEHAHCFLVTHRRDRAVALVAACAPLSIPEEKAEPAPALRIEHPAIATLRLAPKSSPPA